MASGMNLIIALKDSNKYVTKWDTPTSLLNDTNAIDYKQTWNLPDGGTITTNRRITVSGIISSAYVYRTQTLESTLPTTWAKANAKIYMQNADETNLMEYDSSTTMGFTSAKRININMSTNWWYNTPSTTSSGTVVAVIDIDSGLPKTKYTVTSNLDNITFDNAVSSIEEDSEFTFNFTANTGYQIDSLTSNIGTVAISDDKLTATITGTATTAITITGTASVIPKKYSVTYSLTNMSCDNPKTELTENDTFEFTFSADEGNEIESLESNIGTVAISTDKKSAVITGTATQDITITGVAEQKTVTYTIAYSLENMFCVAPIYTIEENKEFNLYFEANAGYVIDSLTTTLGVVEIGIDNKSATITGTATDNIAVVGTASLEKHYINITGSLTNCYCSYDNGELIDTTKPCEIIALNGYVFPSKIMYSYTAVINGENVTKYASVSSDGYRLTFDFVIDDVECTINLDSVYTAEKEVDYVSEFVDIYAVDKSIIKQLANTRFLQIVASTGDVSYIDMGQFIVGLYVLPLGIPEKLITSTKNIKLGYKGTSITAPIINAYSWVYDLGTINIPTTYKNSYDYINTEIYLNVPFFGRLDIPNYLVGYNISVSIIFDCYSGNGTLVISNDFTKSNIEIKTQRIVTDIPYIQTGLNTVFNKLGNTNVNPLINKCFIEVIRNVPYQSDNSFGYKVDENVIIGGVQGYAEFSECLIKSEVATDVELDTIVRLLNEGVIIA